MTPHPQRAAVLEAYQAGVKYEAIKAEFGVSAGAIQYWVVSEGLERRRPPRSGQKRMPYSRISHLHAEGLNDRHIAKVIGFSPEGVRNARRHLGLAPVRQLGRTAALPERLVQYVMALTDKAEEFETHAALFPANDRSHDDLLAAACAMDEAKAAVRRVLGRLRPVGRCG